MKAGDLVTPIGAIGSSGSSYFRLWADFSGQVDPRTVNDRFFLGEVGLVLECRDHAGHGVAHVLSPRGRSGWLSSSNLEVVGEAR